ncbi:MAG: NmrA family NAD(P)-binding protein [Pirellula sp.]
MSERNKQLCILGGAGGQGQAILTAALAKGYACTVLQRASSQVRLPASAQTRIVKGGLEDRRAIQEAIAEASAVVVTIPLTFDSMQMQSMAEMVFEAISEQRVPRFVFNASTMTPDTSTGSEVIYAYRRIARWAEEVDSKVTVIRPTLFLENLLAPWTLAELIAHGTISTALPREEAIAWMSQRELGRMVVAALETDALVGQQVDVGGADQVTGDELSKRLGWALNLPLRFESISPSVLSSRVAPMLGSLAASEIGMHYEHFAATNHPVRSLDTVRNRGRFAEFEADSIERWASDILAPSIPRGSISMLPTEFRLTSRVDINILET